MSLLYILVVSPIVLGICVLVMDALLCIQIVVLSYVFYMFLLQVFVIGLCYSALLYLSVMVPCKLALLYVLVVSPCCGACYLSCYGLCYLFLLQSLLLNCVTSPCVAS